MINMAMMSANSSFNKSNKFIGINEDLEVMKESSNEQSERKNYDLPDVSYGNLDKRKAQLQA